MTKSILILKASKDICGSEVGLITHHCELLGMKVETKEIKSAISLSIIAKGLWKKGQRFDYVYLCSHANKDGFSVDMGDKSSLIPWSKFSLIMCENDILHEDTMFLLACCKGGLFQVATDILACCGNINFVCGVKWNVEAWDLTTGFVVFIHNVEIKKAEPTYAAYKASSATDYTFVCYDRDEIEINPQYEIRRRKLFQELGWEDEVGNWVETDKTIKKNVGII